MKSIRERFVEKFPGLGHLAGCWFEIDDGVVYTAEEAEARERERERLGAPAGKEGGQ